MSTIQKLKVFINIQGKTYETYDKTLDRFPNTLLGTQVKRNSLKSSGNIIYLTQSQRCFDAILFYYQSNGILARPDDISMQEFQAVCNSFQIDQIAVNYVKMKEGYFVQQYAKKVLANRIREKIWLFMDDHAYNNFAYVYALLSIVLIVASTVINCVTSMPTIANDSTNHLETDTWLQTETFINSLFAVEMIVKFITAPDREKFSKNFLNIIDFFAVIPFLITTLITFRGFTNLAFLKALRTVKVLRLLRFSKHSETLGVVVSILSNCLKDVTVLLMCLFLICCIAGSLEYYTQLPLQNSEFDSIPQGMWWALQTVLCLGYGDVIPRGLWGKLVGMLAAIFGALTIMVPLLSLGGRYLKQYTKTFNVILGPDMKNVLETPKTTSSAASLKRMKLIPGFITKKRRLLFERIAGNETIIENTTTIM